MIRPLKLDTSGIEFQLSRIADALEGLRVSTNPEQVWNQPDDGTTVRTFYSNEEEEIVAAHLAKLGKEYKPKQ